MSELPDLAKVNLPDLEPPQELAEPLERLALLEMKIEQCKALQQKIRHYVGLLEDERNQQFGACRPHVISWAQRLKKRTITCVLGRLSLRKRSRTKIAKPTTKQDEQAMILWLRENEPSLVREVKYLEYRWKDEVEPRLQERIAAKEDVPGFLEVIPPGDDVAINTAKAWPTLLNTDELHYLGGKEE